MKLYTHKYANITMQDLESRTDCLCLMLEHLRDIPLVNLGVTKEATGIELTLRTDLSATSLLA
jgi:hypothetical protein